MATKASLTSPDIRFLMACSTSWLVILMNSWNTGDGGEERVTAELFNPSSGHPGDSSLSCGDFWARWDQSRLG